MTRIVDLVKQFLADGQAPESGVDTAQELEKFRQERLKFLYIKDDIHAWKLILNQIDNVLGCTVGVGYEAFAVHPEMHAVVERAVQVISRLSAVISPDERQKFNFQHLQKIRLLAMDLEDIGCPPSRRRLWHVCSVILPKLQQSITGTNRRKTFNDWMASKSKRRHTARTKRPDT